MKGTTGHKRKLNKPKTRSPALALESLAPPPSKLHLPQWRLVSLPSLDCFRPFVFRRCTRIWHDKSRENETIPIWNLIVALAENSGGQWSRFSATPSVRSEEKSTSCHSNPPPLLRHNLPIWVRALSSFIVLFQSIPRNNKYMKKTQSLITQDFFSCEEHGSRTNTKETPKRLTYNVTK